MGEATLPKPLTTRLKGDGSRVFYSDEDLQGGHGRKTLRGLLRGAEEGGKTEKVLLWTHSV